MHPCVKWLSWEQRATSGDGDTYSHSSHLTSSLAIALGRVWAQHCVHARHLGSLGMGSVPQGHAGTAWFLWLGMLTGQELTTRQIPEGWETGQAALPAQPPGLSPEVGLIKASFSWRCGWYCSRAKAGKSHSPIRALVPCGAMLIRRKSGGTKRQQEDGDTSHWSCLLGQKHCEHLEAADFL